MEYIDIVDDNDQVIGRATRDEVNEKHLRCRIVHALVFNNKGEMAIHLRSAQRPFRPLHWSTAAGGFVQAGEKPEEAVKREMEEEIGIDSPLNFLFKDWYYGLTGAQHLLNVYKTIHNGPFIIDPVEVERIEFFSLEKMREMVLAGEKFHPELLFLLNKYF
ncbi:MAG: hypothetical protein UR53_C0004G0015 [Candidatus Magasanikbacteria bacterium GW2011_GWC2_34_16]|uniref:Nudix hydrolase domain-containing protein n=2 Tax=Candidatus Magasanikiibacteriota TaxID=1752731 RepID=A0A0G0DVT7_9BACT|nr:MAG: hypothetical protein UR53_C0004G0015 [Candidatus Magasanikbacteria bacterium GW2011_GWC2_34_16]